MDPMGEVAQQARLVSTTSRVAETTSCQTVFSTTAYDCWTTDGYTNHFKKEPCSNVIKNIKGYDVVVLKASEWNPPEGCIRFSTTSMALIEAQRAHWQRLVQKATYSGGIIWSERMLATPVVVAFRSYMDVSKNSGFSPQIIHFNRVFHF